MTRWLMAGWLMLAAAPASSQTPPPASVQTAGPVAPAADDLANIWLVIYNVLPARAPEFEAVALRVQEAMRKSPDARRQRQAAGVRVHRSALPTPEGNIVYFVQVPTEANNDADRTGLDVLIEAVLPAEATALQTRLDAVLDPNNPSGNTLMLAVR